VTAHPSGRDYFRVYRVQRAAEREFLLAAVEHAGARRVSDSGSTRAPLHLVIQDGDGVRHGALIYLFSAGHQQIRNRPADEHRLQIKYGDITEEWRQQDHSVGLDPTGLEVTAVLAVHASANLFIGLDPFSYDPLPMGIQVGFKAAEVDAATATGWHVWERINRPGTRRDPRATGGLETILAFGPDRLLDYLAFERHAQTLRLDPALRFRAAEAAATERASMRVHDLEAAYGLSALEILDIVSERSRLAMAVRGGVAEHHLGRELLNDPAVAEAVPGQHEGPPDFHVSLMDGRTITVECKNASPKAYADGTPKVEVQKTRASRGDPLSRLYRAEAFDVVAVCMYGPIGRWVFRYRRTADLERHPDHPDRLAPLQRVTESWARSLAEALDS
jgi:hypothetical protein